MLCDTDVKFIDRRRQLVDNWRLVGTAALALILTLVVYLFWHSPLLVNPHHVMRLVESDSLTASNMTIAAIMLPIVSLLLIGLTIAMIAGMFRAFEHERRLIAIIDELAGADHKRRDDE